VAYSIEFKPSAVKELAGMPKQDRHRIATRIDALAADPRPDGVTKLAGAESLYRIRSGDFRVIYEIQDKRVLVLVLRIAHRREVIADLRS
jgi:mRNA interferase RelE/StbE